MKRIFFVAAPTFEEAVAKADAARAVIISGPHAFDRLSSEAVDPDGSEYDYGSIGSDTQGFALLAMRIT